MSAFLCTASGVGPLRVWFDPDQPTRMSPSLCRGYGASGEDVADIVPFKPERKWLGPFTVNLCRIGRRPPPVSASRPSSGAESVGVALGLLGEPPGLLGKPPRILDALEPVRDERAVGTHHGEGVV
jgi:hypothetical protein